MVMVIAIVREACGNLCRMQTIVICIIQNINVKHRAFACKQRRFLHAFECSLDDCLWGDADEGAVRTLALSFEHLGFDSF